MHVLRDCCVCYSAFDQRQHLNTHYHFLLRCKEMSPKMSCSLQWLLKALKALLWKTLNWEAGLRLWASSSNPDNKGDWLKFGPHPQENHSSSVWPGKDRKKAERGEQMLLEKGMEDLMTMWKTTDANMKKTNKK